MQSTSNGNAIKRTKVFCSSKFRIPSSNWTDPYASDKSAGQVVHSFLAKLLTRFPQLSETVIQFDFEKVGIFTTHSRKKPGKIKFELLRFVLPLRFVLGNLYRTEDGVRSDWSFELPEVSEVETQRLSFFRRAATGGAEIEFQTGKIPVPVEVIAPFCPVFGQFGSGCRLSGVFSVEFHSDTGFTGFQPRTVRIADAVFRRIDLSRIASYYTSFAVSGAVDSLHVRKAVFGPDTFFADGAFMLVDGFIDKTLFNRFVRQFDLTVQPGELIESPQKTVPFEECVLQFRLAPDGLAFWPEESWGDVFMYRNGDGFRTENMTVRFPGTVSASSRRPISYHALLSVLAPDTAPVVPLTPSLKQLYSVIPVESELQPTQAPAREGSPYPVMVDPARANPAKANQTRAVEN